MTEIFGAYVTCFFTGVAAGVMMGFISWGIGFAVYSIIKIMKS